MKLKVFIFSALTVAIFVVFIVLVPGLPLTGSSTADSEAVDMAIESGAKPSVQEEDRADSDREQGEQAFDAKDPVSLRARALEDWAPWSEELLKDLHGMHPADLLAFLNDDQLLQHDDARNLVSKIYGACGVYLGLLSARESGARIDTSKPAYQVLNNPGAKWCESMTEGDTAAGTRDRLVELQEIASTVDPAGTTRRQLAAETIRRAQAAGDGQLLDLLRNSDSLTTALAVELLWEERNREFLEDWSLMESLSTMQRQNVMSGLYTTLECQQLGDCSIDTLVVGSLCLSPTFQCDGQISLDGALYQSLSRRQLDAYYQLITRIRQIRASAP